MSWYWDIGHMHEKYGVDKWLQEASLEKEKELMKLRMRMLTEEYAETMNAYLQGDAEEVIDGLIDLCVIAIGTLDIAGVNGELAWQKVLTANLEKEVGIKEGRPNPLGLPDLVKPTNWKAPDHSDNHGAMRRMIS